MKKFRLPIFGRSQQKRHKAHVGSMKRSAPVRDPRQPAQPKAPAETPVGTDLFGTILSGQQFFWLGHNRSEFYRFMRDRIPIISSAVWTWVHLCATPQTLLLEGSDTAKESAQTILHELDKRILPNPATRQPAIEHIIEQFFLELFTVGRFAATIVLTKDGKSIDYLENHNTDLISWKMVNHRWQPYQKSIEPNGTDTLIPTENLFYASFGADVNNPAGTEPLSCIPFVTEIQESLAFDMAKSSHSAGNPRLHIAITPPPAFAHESEKEYQSRINSYFDDTVSEFKNLDPEDTLFTWEDINVKVLGMGMGNFAWRLNREQIIEDVITGLHLYPWALGRSHGTTKNWVESQFNVLMQVVDSVQNQAIALANWIRNKELELKGSKVTSAHVFAPNQDPFILNKMNARDIEFRTIDNYVRRGYISKDEGAQRLGLPKAHQQDNTQSTQEPQK